MRKPPYSPAKIRLVEWQGQQPAVGDELVTDAGSRYQILRIRGKTHHCLTLPPEAEVQGPQHRLYWIPRAKKTRRVL
jgi:hypothetical protein